MTSGICSIEEEQEDLLPNNWENFPDGSILRLEFHNFLTYEDTVCKPGENLNLILGHNGSGKSSIICAICLVFGGSPKLLGRSEKITEYIRHGHTEAYIEVVIADTNKGPQKIHLSIRVGKSPEYKLNGEVSSQASIRELTKSYNIQIDNPCAFLAQDKVKSFSEQSSVELLFNTEKAASAELYEEHVNLIKSRDDFKEIDNKCMSAQAAVKQINESIAKLEPLVENYRKKRQMQKKLRLLEKKSAVLNFQLADSFYNKELMELNKIDAKTKSHIDSCEKINSKITLLGNKAQNQRKFIDENKQKGREMLRKVESVMDRNIIHKRLDKAKRDLMEQRNIFDKNKTDRLECEQRIEDLEKKFSQIQEDLEGYEAFLEDSRNEEKKIMQFDRELRHEEDEMSKMYHTIKTMQEKQREKERQSREGINRRLNYMKSFSSDAAKAWEYYYKNRNKFKSDIYVPIMDMTLKSADVAKLIENTVGFRDWCMFVCSNKEDELNINDHSKGWKINSAVVRPDKVNVKDINASIPSSLREMGFRYFVSEKIDAPDPLKQYLCNVYHLNRIPCGGDAVEENIGEIAEKMVGTQYQVIITGNIRSQISVSKYSGEVTQTQAELRTPKYWTDAWFTKPVQKTFGGSSNAEIDELQKKVDEQTKEFHNRKTELQKLRDKFKNETSVWRDRKQMAATTKNNLESERRRLERLENEVIDIAEAEREFQKEQLSVKQRVKDMFNECYELQKKYIDLYKEISCSIAIYNSCELKKHQLTVELNKLNDKTGRLKALRSNFEENKNNTLNMKKRASAELKERCQLEHTYEDRMDNIEKAIWKKMLKVFDDEKIPNCENILEKQINAENTRLKIAEDGDSGSIEDERNMEKLKKDLIEENSKLEKLIEVKENYENNLANEIEKWKSKMEEMIEKINDSYRASFQKLECVGEVHLECPQNPLDISNYGIMIMVCFRTGEKLKRLDQNVQSGGERSVSTMLYLLALQQLCPVPFRCVDEINQGMDPTNERKVFEIMVDLWSGEGKLAKTQYFLLTPKLLHGLTMNERVTVQIVHSAVPAVYKNWTSQKFIAATTSNVVDRGFIRDEKRLEFARWVLEKLADRLRIQEPNSTLVEKITKKLNACYNDDQCFKDFFLRESKNEKPEDANKDISQLVKRQKEADDAQALLDAKLLVSTPQSNEPKQTGAMKKISTMLQVGIRNRGDNKSGKDKVTQK